MEDASTAAQSQIRRVNKPTSTSSKSKPSDYRYKQKKKSNTKMGNTWGWDSSEIGPSPPPQSLPSSKSDRAGNSIRERVCSNIIIFPVLADSWIQCAQTYFVTTARTTGMHDQFIAEWLSTAMVSFFRMYHLEIIITLR